MLRPSQKAFKKRVIPAVVQDDKTGEVLMQRIWTWRHIKNSEDRHNMVLEPFKTEYWNKGANSGNYQQVMSYHATATRIPC